MEDKNKLPCFLDNRLIKTKAAGETVTVNIKGYSSAVGTEIRIAGTNAVGIVTEHSKTDTEHILTLKPIPTEDADFEVIQPLQIEKKN